MSDAGQTIDLKTAAREAEDARLRFLAQIEKRRGPFVKASIALRAFGDNPTAETMAVYVAAKAALVIEDKALAELDAVRSAKSKVWLERHRETRLENLANQITEGGSHVA